MPSFIHYRTRSKEHASFLLALIEGLSDVLAGWLSLGGIHLDIHSIFLHPVLHPQNLHFVNW